MVGLLVTAQCGRLIDNSDRFFVGLTATCSEHLTQFTIISKLLTCKDYNPYIFCHSSHTELKKNVRYQGCGFDALAWSAHQYR